MIVNQKLLANLFNTNTREINNFCKKLLAKKIQYRFLKKRERDSLVIKMVQKILKDTQVINSPVRKKVWNSGWRETFNSYLKNLLPLEQVIAEIVPLDTVILACGTFEYSPINKDRPKPPTESLQSIESP